MRLLPFTILIVAATVTLRLWLAPSESTAAGKRAEPTAQTGLVSPSSPPPAVATILVLAPAAPRSVLPNASQNSDFGRPMPPPPLFLLDEGGKADSVAVLPSPPPTPFSVTAARYGLPLASMDIRMEGAGHGERVTPMAWSVDADGKIRGTTRGAAGLATGFAVLIAALLGGACIDGLIRRAESPANWPGGLAVAGILVGCGQALTPDAGPLGGDLMPLIAVSVAWMPARNRAALLLAAMALYGLVGMATTEIVAPHPALAGLYGPLGLMGWDILWSAVIAISGLAAAVLLRWRDPVRR